MVRIRPYALVYDPEVVEPLRSIEAQYHSLIRTEIEMQLKHEPDVETTNRKPLTRPSILGTGRVERDAANQDNWSGEMERTQCSRFSAGALEAAAHKLVQHACDESLIGHPFLRGLSL